MSELPIAAIERLIRKAGAPRVSASACEALRDIIEDVAVDVATEAVALSKHAGRKTVTADDVRLAART